MEGRERRTPAPSLSSDSAKSLHSCDDQQANDEVVRPKTSPMTWDAQCREVNSGEGSSSSHIERLVALFGNPVPRKWIRERVPELWCKGDHLTDFRNLRPASESSHKNLHLSLFLAKALLWTALLVWTTTTDMVILIMYLTSAMVSASMLPKRF